MRIKFPAKLKFIGILFLLISYTISAQTYVSVTGSGNGNGSSWANASTLQNAITNASANSQLWIQQGTYTISSTLICSAHDISIYGGFSGNETTLNQRNWENNLTTFDGQGSVKIMRFNSNNGIIDGIRFINGYVTGAVTETNDGGGALRLAYDNQIIRNCTFLNNTSTSERGAGAIFIWHGGNQLIENCIFNNNTQTYAGGANGGGAIHNWDENVIIRNCQFNNNSSTNSGGAIYTWGDNLTIDGCHFENNQSESYGGAIHINYYNVKISNSIFTGNTANNRGGAINNSDIAEIANCLFHNNSTDEMGGAIANGEELYVTNSTFVSNNNTAIVYNNYDNITTHIFNSIFYSNSAAASKLKDIDKASINQDQSQKDFRHNIFEENSFGTNNLVGVNPMFLDFNGGNFALEASGPAHDYGNNALYNQVATVTLSNSTDLAGNPRLFGSNIDLGAYEIQEVLSVEEISSEKNIHIYPNPATDVLHITGEIDDFAKIEIYTIQGQCVFQKSINTIKETSVDITSFSSGVYLLTFLNSTDKQTYRIIKK